MRISESVLIESLLINEGEIISKNQRIDYPVNRFTLKENIERIEGLCQRRI